MVYMWMRACLCMHVCIRQRKWENLCVCACADVYAHWSVYMSFLTSLLRHSQRESGVKWKGGSHSVSIHGLGPRGPARAPMFIDKASPAGPRHTHTARGAKEGEEHRGGREKVTRGGKMEKDRGNRLCGSTPCLPIVQVWRVVTDNRPTQTRWTPKFYIENRDWRVSFCILLSEFPI